MVSIQKVIADYQRCNKIKHNWNKVSITKDYDGNIVLYVHADRHNYESEFMKLKRFVEMNYQNWYIEKPECMVERIIIENGK